MRSPSCSGSRLTIGLPRDAPAGHRQLVDLEPVKLAAAREAQQRVVRVGDEQFLDEILVLHRGRRTAATAAALRAVLADRLRLGVAAVRERHDDVPFSRILWRSGDLMRIL